MISGVKLSVVLPQAIGISLRNRIGDSARDVHPLTLPFIGLTLGLLFTTIFSVYAGFWPKVAYIRGFLAKSHVYT